MILHYYGESADAAEIERALTEDPELATRYAALKNELAALPAMPAPAADPELAGRVWRSIRPGLKPHRPFLNWFAGLRASLTLRPGFALAAALALAVAAGFLLGRDGRRDGRREWNRGFARPVARSARAPAARFGRRSPGRLGATVHEPRQRLFDRRFGPRRAAPLGGLARGDEPPLPERRRALRPAPDRRPARRARTAAPRALQCARRFGRRALRHAAAHRRQRPSVQAPRCRRTSRPRRTKRTQEDPHHDHLLGDSIHATFDFAAAFDFPDALRRDAARRRRQRRPERGLS